MHQRAVHPIETKLINNNLFTKNLNRYDKSVKNEKHYSASSIQNSKYEEFCQQQQAFR